MIPHLCRPIPWPTLLRGNVGLTGAGVIGQGDTLPASPVNGQLFWHDPTGSDTRRYLKVYNDTAWEIVHTAKDVPHSTFSWVNQGGATATQADDRSVLLTAPVGAGDNWRLRTVATPTVPYTLICAFWPMLAPTFVATENIACGVGWRAVGLGTFELFRFYHDYSAFFNLVADFSRWNDPTTFSAVGNGPFVPNPVQFGSAVWVKLVDDNTNRLVYFSPDGVDWWLWHVQGRTTFQTPDQLCFGANADGTTFASYIKMLHWHTE